MAVVNLADENQPALLVDDETGEILEVPQGVDALFLVAHRRHDAKQQEDAWKAQRAMLDAVLLKKQEEKKAEYGDIIVAIKGGSYSKTDAEALANLVYERFRSAFSDDSVAVSAVLGLIAAASGFAKDKIPQPTLGIYEEATEWLEKRPWVETRPVLRRPR